MSERALEAAQASGLIRRDEPLLVLLSGGADSVCLVEVAKRLGAWVTALHVNHGLRGRESDEDAEFCRGELHAEVVRDNLSQGTTEAALRAARYRLTDGRGVRATGHTASDQVETLLYRLVSSGTTRGIKVRREDGVVRPLLAVWRDETAEYCRAERLAFRNDSSNAHTKRGVVRDHIVPLLRGLHPAAEDNLFRAVEDGDRLPRPLERAFGELLASPAGSKRVDLAHGRVAVREYDRVWLERAPVALEGVTHWGRWTLRPRVEGLRVRSWRAGDRLATRQKKVQDLFVDAKIPRSEREAWPVVVRGSEVVAVPGIAEAPGFEGAVEVTCEA